MEVGNMSCSPVPASLIRHHGVLTVWQFGSKYKVTWLKSVRQKGYELAEFCDDPDKPSGQDKKETSVRNDCKLANNISRARSKVFEYAFCNDWDYFITLTIDPAKFDRYDLGSYIKALGRFINNYNTHHHARIRYILIPERHKDGAWHMHGLVSGILPKHLETNAHGYLDFPMYSGKFGHCSIGRIKSHEAVSKYITKYITKSFASANPGQPLYYCSKGLNRSSVVCTFDNVADAGINWDYVHPDGYCKTAMVDDLGFLDSMCLSFC